MRRSLLWTALLGAAMAYGTGCDDGGTGGTGGNGGETSTGGGGAGGSATGGSATGGSATGGSATGGSATGGSATGGSATGGTGGSMMGNVVNGCDPATAEDHTADATTTVMSSGLKYAPPCIKISAGSSVKFSSNFMTHPLVGGEVVGGMKQPDANSPIKQTSTGTEVTFSFPDAGAYGYYCELHAGSGMVGAVFVE